MRLIIKCAKIVFFLTILAHFKSEGCCGYLSSSGLRLIVITLQLEDDGQGIIYRYGFAVLPAGNEIWH